MEQYLMYLRKSQMDKDFENLSVEETLRRHRIKLEEFCRQRKLNVTVILEEVVTGESLAGRPQMMKALELINTGEFSGIVCIDLDRLSRGSSLDSGYITQILQINNCPIITPDKTYDLLNESDEQFADMKFMFSRYELKTITKRLVAGRNQSASEGKYCGGKSPYGYEKYKLQGTKGFSLNIVPDEAKVVQMIFDMYTEERIGFNTIAHRLNQLHIQSPFGAQWAQSSIFKILTSEIYIGKIPWKKNSYTKKVVNGNFEKIRTRKKEYEVHDGLHEAIVSEEQFALARQIREDNYIRPTKTSHALQNPFAGLLKCGICGGRVVRKPQTRKNVQDRYKCDIEGRGCTCKSTTMSEVENAILTEMRTWFDGYVLRLKQIKPEDDNSLTTAFDLLQKELSTLTAQQDNICDLLEKGVYTVQMFTKRNTALQTDIDRITEAVANLKQQIAEQSKEQTIVETIIPSTQKLLDNYEDLTAKEKNELWKSVLYKIEYSKEEAGGEFKIKIYPKLGQTQ